MQSDTLSIYGGPKPIYGSLKLVYGGPKPIYGSLMLSYGGPKLINSDRESIYGALECPYKIHEPLVLHHKAFDI